MRERLILMGVIGKPHGVRGLVRVKAYTEDPQALERLSPLLDASGRRFGLRWMAEGIAQLTELAGPGACPVSDRDAVARLTNIELFVPRSALPETAAEEFYLADLVGLEARDASGAAIGRITAVHDYGAGHSLEISGGMNLVIPFTRAAVPVVDLAAGLVVVNPPDEIELRP